MLVKLSQTNAFQPGDWVVADDGRLVRQVLSIQDEHYTLSTSKSDATIDLYIPYVDLFYIKFDPSDKNVNQAFWS